ncbi:MAG: methylated-DNA--[protein]-cysteine S-methyltransferase [Pseudoclavibacter sp.]
MTTKPTARTSPPRASGTTATPLLDGTVDVAGHAFTVLIDATTGDVLAGGFCPADDLFKRLDADDRGTRAPAAPEHPVLAALRAYDAGDLSAIDGIAVRQSAPPFRADVHAALRRIPPGTALTYRELAMEAGRPAAVRAAGSGCATNLVALIVPCHRVRRTGGSLGGYAYGTEVKAALLAHEGVGGLS